MKKKFLFSLITCCFIFLTACSNDSDVLNKESNNTEKFKTNIVSTEQAEAFGTKAIDVIYEDSDLKDDLSEKNEEDLTPQATPIVSKDNKIAMYAINFGNDDGYILISAYKEDPISMLTFNDKGHFNYEDIDKKSPFYLWLQKKIETISEDLQTKIDSTNENYIIWNDINGSTENSVIDFELINESNQDSTFNRAKHSNSYNLDYVKPHYVIKNFIWGQGTGYNADAKISGCPAGCPAVSVGLLCKTLKYPNMFDYSKMWRSLNTSKSNPISKMFRTIADKIPNFSWSVNGSGATVPSIVTGLHRLGYNNASDCNFNFQKAYNSIKNSEPILLCGFDNNGGHIWICDGYKEYKWAIKHRVNGIVVSTSYKYTDMLYMNWGWNGYGNGWIDQEDWSYFNGGKTMIHNFSRN